MTVKELQDTLNQILDDINDCKFWLAQEKDLDECLVWEDLIVDLSKEKHELEKKIMLSP